MQNNNKKYFAPEIKLISIDNDISLILASETPPEGPGEETYNNHFQSITDPYKSTTV